MTARPLTVAVDGPGGVGKTTASRRLAQELGIPYLSTGAMYRAVGLQTLSAGIDLGDDPSVAELLEGLRMEVELRDDEPVLRVNGVEQGVELRSPEATRMAANVAVLPRVRRFLVERQQQVAEAVGGVIEGRDIGTKVLPDAPYKFFLDATPEVRARRRARELEERGQQVDFDALLADLTARDQIDRTRSESPLTLDDSYVYIDTSEMRVDEVVERMLGIVSRKS